MTTKRMMMIAAFALCATAACGEDEVTSKGGAPSEEDENMSDAGSNADDVDDDGSTADDSTADDTDTTDDMSDDTDATADGGDVTTDGGTEEEPPTGSCETDGECNDENSCTLDVCSSGTCTYVPANSEGCEAPVECTTDADCEGTTDCVAMFCISGRCASQPMQENTSCDTGNQCTADTCDGWGHCIEGRRFTCDDSNVCTTDRCDETAGCVFAYNTDPCDDQVDCTSSVCEGGVCVGTPFPGQIGDGTLCCVSDADCRGGTCGEDHTCSTVSSGGGGSNEPPTNNGVVISFNSATSMITVTGNVRTATIDCQDGATPGSLTEYYLVRWGGGPIPSVHHSITADGPYEFQVGPGFYDFTPRGADPSGGTCWASLNGYDVQAPVQRVLDNNGASYHLELTVE